MPQTVPGALGGLEGTPSVHTSSVQGFPSSTGHGAPPLPLLLLLLLLVAELAEELVAPAPLPELAEELVAAPPAPVLAVSSPEPHPSEWTRTPRNTTATLSAVFIRTPRKAGSSTLDAVPSDHVRRPTSAGAERKVEPAWACALTRFQRPRR
jgi:hypothetical protein